MSNPMQASNDDPLEPLGDDEIRKLELIAHLGNRRMILWELASNGRDFCGVDFTAQEMGIDSESLREKVEAFVDDMSAHMDNYEGGTSWDRLESQYGTVADAIEDRVAGDE